MIRIFVFFSFFLSLLLLIPHTVAAQQEGSTVTNLSFGTFAVRNNDAIYSIVVDINNNFSHDPGGFISASNPQRAEYDFIGYPANTPLNVTISDGSLTIGGGGVGPAFSVRDYTHNSPVTNNDGEATLLFGATLRTSGSGTHYDSGSYSGTVDMSIDY